MQLPAAALPHAGEPGPRQEILLAALALFAARGYHGTSIRDIASLAGCGSASLYSHFQDKEAILAVLVLLGHEAQHRELVAALAMSGADPRDQLRQVTFANVRLCCQYSALARVGRENDTRAYLSAAAYAPARVLRLQSGHIMTDIVIRGIDQKVFRVPAVEATLEAIATMGTAAATWFPEHGDSLTPQDVATTYAELALRIVGAHSPECTHPCDC